MKSTAQKKKDIITRQRWQRADPSMRRCDCGGQAVKFAKGFVCQRCWDIERNQAAYMKAWCGFGGSGGMAE